MYVVRCVTVLKLRVVGVKVVFQLMRVDDVRERRSVESEEDRTQY